MLISRFNRCKVPENQKYEQMNSVQSEQTLRMKGIKSELEFEIETWMVHLFFLNIGPFSIISKNSIIKMKKLDYFHKLGSWTKGCSARITMAEATQEHF